LLAWTNSGLPGVDAIRDRGVDAHLLRGGVGHLDIFARGSLDKKVTSSVGLWPEHQPYRRVSARLSVASGQLAGSAALEDQPIVPLTV
jgi:hypothetical protein